MFSSATEISPRIAWVELEGHIVECIRKTNSEAAESRVREVEAVKAIAKITAELAELQQQMKNKTELIVSLERDLNEANFALETGLPSTRCDTT